MASKSTRGNNKPVRPNQPDKPNQPGKGQNTAKIKQPVKGQPNNKNTEVKNKSHSPTDVKTKNTISVKRDLLDSLDHFLSHRIKTLFYICLGLLTLFSILIFDVKVSPGGDDSAYILRAYDFIHNFIFPGYQGPVYPFVLSPFIAVFGIDLPLLKILSLIFTVVAFVFIFKTFVNRIPNLILASALILVSISYFVLYFASQTYSEAFFLMLQSVFFWYFAEHFIDERSETKAYKKYIIAGLLLFLMSVTKNVATFAFIPVIGFLLLYKQWKGAGYTLLSFIGFSGVFEIIKRIAWKGQGFQLSSQSSGLMNKDFYNPALGKEDTLGFIQRFFDNSNLYFSKHLFKFLGLVNETSTDINPFLTILIYVIIVLVILFVFKRNKILFLTGIYTLAMSALTFLSVQKQWDQYRLIIIFYPFLLIILFTGIYYFLKQNSLKGLQFIIPLLIVILFSTELNVISGKVKIQRPVLARNLDGDLLYGLTPDWINYIKMSQWASKNIPKNFNIGCRKPEISFVYSGRKYYGIFKVPSIKMDTLLNFIMNKPGVYIGVSEDQLTKKNISANPEMIARSVAYINGNFSFNSEKSVDGNVVAVYHFTDEEFPQWEAIFKQLGIYYDKDIKTWAANLQNSGKDYAVFIPDLLLDQLRKNNVHYLLLASLRINPAENTGSIISTIHRYIYFIQVKYPYKFKEIHRIGDTEPSSLYEVNLN